MGELIDMEWKGCESLGCWTHYVTLNMYRNKPNITYLLELWPHPWLWPWVFKVRFCNSCIWGMRGLIDMEWSGCEWIGWLTHYGTLNFDLTYDLDLRFYKVKFWNSLITGIDWVGQMTWNEMDVSWPHPCPWPPRTLTLDFQGQILTTLKHTTEPQGCMQLGHGWVTVTTNRSYHQPRWRRPKTVRPNNRGYQENLTVRCAHMTLTCRCHITLRISAMTMCFSSAGSENLHLEIFRKLVVTVRPCWS